MAEKLHTSIALLRGINVGGNNLIKMADLKACFEEMGFENVTTYIQSGNVVFQSPETDPEVLTDKIEKALSKQFGYSARAVTISASHLAEVVKRAPHGFGSKPKEYRYDVLFLKKPQTVADALKNISAKEGVDQVWGGKDVLYFSRLVAKITQSRLNRMVGTPLYKNITIRNWNTTTKLLALTQK